jgi:YVTN family beta-propeller protein
MEILLKQIFTSLHIIGAVIGAGAAFMSDATFLKSIRNENIDKIEFSFLNLFSKFVWGGIGLIVLSGVGLFTLQPDVYVSSSKFLAKMTIVLIIVLNGVLFHALHIPYIKKSWKQKLFASLPTGEGAVIALSGAVSMVSWMSALVLGTWRSVPYGYLEIMAVYVFIVSCGMVGALITLKKMLKREDIRIALQIIGVCVGGAVLLGAFAVSYSGGGTDTSSTDESQELSVYSMEDVAQHSVQSDCWVVVDGLVFDLTPFVRLHASSFACGTDVSTNYHANHGSEIRPQMMQFHIGSIAGEREGADATTEPHAQENIYITPTTELYEEIGSWDVRDLMVVVERDRQSLLLIDSKRHVPVGRIEQVGYQPHTNVFSPDGTYNYLISRDGWVTKTNLQTLETEAYVRVGKNSRGTALTDDGTYLVIGNYEPGSIVVLRADTLEIVTEIPLETVRDGAVITSRAGALVESGTQVIVALKDLNSVWVLETANDDIRIVQQFEHVGGVDSVLHDGYLTPDGAYFIVAAQDANVVWVLDTETMTEVARVPTGKQPHTGPGATWEHVTFVPSLGEGMITAIDTNTWQPLKYIPTGGPGLFVRHSPLPEYPYIWADVAFGEQEDEIAIIDARSLEVVETLVPMEGKRSIHPEFTHDGKYVYVLVWLGDKIFVYDADTFAVVTTIDATTPSLISNVGARLEEPGI